MRKASAFDPRQEMNRADFEILHMRDSYLKDVQLHHHDFYEIYFLISGDASYTIESRVYHLMPGDILLISPKELHQICIRNEMASYERYVLWVDPQMLHRLSTELTDLKLNLDTDHSVHGNLLRLRPEDRATMQQLFERLWEESDSERYGADLMRKNIISLILVQLNRLVEKDSNHFEEVTHASKAVSQVVDYINLHYGEPLSLDMLAAQVFVSKYHLSHEFNRQVGTSVYRYIQKKRLLIARQLLSQGNKPNQIYADCGFKDYAGFYRAFRNEYGVAPREYALSADQNLE
jgi:AraC-like DNA-binding protein